MKRTLSSGQNRVKHGLPAAVVAIWLALALYFRPGIEDLLGLLVALSAAALVAAAWLMRRSGQISPRLAKGMAGSFGSLVMVQAGGLLQAPRGVRLSLAVLCLYAVWRFYDVALAERKLRASGAAGAEDAAV